MTTVMTGLFDSPADSAAVVHTLEARGIPASRISVVAGESVPKDAFAIDTHSKLPEGVSIGALSGGALGALVAGFTTVGALVTGGAALVAAGPLVAALAGAGAGAAGGSIIGGAIGAAIPEHEVKHYQNAIEKGSVLVGVETENSDEKSMVKDVFEHFDAEKISHA